MINRRHLLFMSLAAGSGGLEPAHATRARQAGLPADLTGGVNPEREYVYATAPTVPGTRDAVNVWIEEEHAEFGMRIGVEAALPDWSRHEIWLDIAYADGRVLSLRDKGAVHSPTGPDGKSSVLGAGPLGFRCLRPFDTWTTHFDGLVPEITAQNLIDEVMPPQAPLRQVRFDIDMHMAVPPYVPGSLLAEAGARLQGGDEGAFMSPRYEQLFSARGTLSVDGRRHTFGARGLRIRRQGVRKFEGFAGHCWQSALFPSGKAFGYIIYPPHADGTPSFGEGYVYHGAGQLQPARLVQVPWLTRLVTNGDSVPVVLQIADGQVRIEGTTFVNTRSRGSVILPPDFPIVQQSHVRYRWDGEETVGMMERSSTPDKFNPPAPRRTA